MEKAIMLDFPVDEYRKRLKKFIGHMDRLKLDAVIMTTKENTRYFSGFQMITWDSKISKPGTIVITSDGEITLVGAHSGLGTMQATTWVEDIRPFDKSGRDGMCKDYPKAIYDVLVKKGLHNGRVGMETGVGFRPHLNFSDLMQLLLLLNQATIVDATPAIWACRSIKSPLEMEMLRRACDINVKAFKKAFNTVVPGITEIELYRNLMVEMYKLGADETKLLGLRAGAERYSQGNSPPGDRPINKGEIILIDGGPTYKGYKSDIIREAIIGQPTARQRELYDFAVAACYKGLEVIGPGIKAAEVSRVVDKFVCDHGYDDLYQTPGWSGHAMGLDTHELPMISVDSDVILEPGMVFAVEPAIYEPGVGMFNIEENILITEKGYELLTPLDTNLLIL